MQAFHLGLSYPAQLAACRRAKLFSTRTSLCLEACKSKKQLDGVSSRDGVRKNKLVTATSSSGSYTEERSKS